MKIKSNKELSFATRLKAGATKEELMKKYCLTEKEFDKTVAGLEKIKAGVRE
ncbi:MAG: hypothetical protein Q8J68_08045 [Methanolobus sp.]|uniref:hypothetical protein n=1 Tax=Methanolobus sp. TaxID=1874737 RepID=UPI0027318B11|nr:hypothetical protein [Methanolobus sp.]MDP2217220.1 hypothetical protein [Methanolobus sp.]